MKQLTLGAALALSIASAAHAQRSGTYAVEGAEANGTTYTGSVQLATTGPSTWTVTWRLAGNTTRGIGMAIPDTGLLALGFTVQRDQGWRSWSCSQTVPW